MTDLIPTTALGAEMPRRADFERVSLRERTDLALASLAVRRGAGKPAPIGLTLPEPGHWTANATAAAFWTGPDQWMIVAEGRAEVDFGAALKPECQGGAVTEQTDGWVVLEIGATSEARAIDTLLERLVNLDIAALGAGRATRTELDHMGVFVIRPEENRLLILGMRSFAESLWYAVAKAAERLG